MIWTSNYFISKSQPNQIGISRGAPKWWIGDTFIELAPATWEMIRMKDWEKFKPLFKAQLAKLDVHEWAEKCQGKILLCWEAPYNDCHRKLVREWFIENGYEAQEWQKPGGGGTLKRVARIKKEEKPKVEKPYQYNLLELIG